MDGNGSAADTPHSTGAAEAPPTKRIVPLAKRTFREFQSDDVPGLAAEIAYHAIFAIPPFIIFLVSMAALVNQVTAVPVVDQLNELIERGAPGETQDLLNQLVRDAIARVGGGFASFSVLAALALAIWSGSNGIQTLIKAFNRAYDVEEGRAFVRKRLVSIGLTLLVGVLVNLAFALFVFGGRIGFWLAEWLGLGSAFNVAWGLLRWPLAVVLFMFVLSVLYYLGPNVEQSFRWVSPGSVVATVLWVLVALGFRVYLSVSNPGTAYGAAGSIVVLLFFLYLTAMAFVLGAEVNAVVGRQYDPETIRDLASDPGKVESPEDHAEARERLATIESQERRGERSGEGVGGWLARWRRKARG